MSFLRQTIRREVLLQWRTLRSVINASLFFVMVLLLFPLGFEANVSLLQKVLPGLVWIAALFAFFLSAEGVFQEEYEVGVLEQWLISSKPLHTRIRVKLLVHWLTHILPLLLLCCVVAIVFDLRLNQMGVLMLSLTCGTPTLYMLCAFSAAFGLGLKNQGLFTALIVLPLTLPVMIFGGGVLTSVMQNISVSGHLALLLAIAILAVFGIPYAISAVIRVGVADVGH